MCCHVDLVLSSAVDLMCCPGINSFSPQNSPMSQFHRQHGQGKFTSLSKPSQPVRHGAQLLIPCDMGLVVPWHQPRARKPPAFKVLADDWGDRGGNNPESFPVTAPTRGRLPPPWRRRLSPSPVKRRELCASSPELPWPGPSVICKEAEPDPRSSCLSLAMPWP